ncbi:glycosyltransferase [Microcella alkalica]|uniref:Glycosyltransferase 2-like domain-containing protein n=1 Tax=Microcella alkalica TaxID=355930 RepID=A0A839EHA1_9MICO|nr:hypothetical protein [Microcella alkalica]
MVVVNFRGAADTIEAVQHLLDGDWPRERLDVVIVENGSGDESAERIHAAFDNVPAVTIVESSQNLGFTGGSNLGARNARGSTLAFLNNDARPEPSWIPAALEQFAVSSRVAAVASKVLDFEGRTIDFVGSGLTWFGMGYKEHVTEVDSGAYDEARDLLFGTGSALFVRRAQFEELGGFDEGLFMFYDDVDLGWRLNMRGYRVRFAPGSVVRHKHHGSMSSFGQHREMYLLERNALMILYKNLSDTSLASFLPAALSLVSRRAIAKSGLDAESFDLRRLGNDSNEMTPTVTVDKSVLAGLFAVDRFVEELPHLTEKRGVEQAARTVADEQLFHLFGDAFLPLNDSPHYRAGLDHVVDAFNIRSSFAQRRVLVITGDSLGAKMAGPALRAWKIAEALSAQNEVRLVTWNQASRPSSDFEVHRVRLGNEREMMAHETWAEVIIFQGHAIHHFETIRDSEKVIVIDLYDPMHLEQLEQGREWGSPAWRAQVASANDVLNEQLLRGDFFICASERQRLFWMGQLAGLGRINPDTYMADPNLERLIDIVPFGLDERIPAQTHRPIRDGIPAIGERDKVIIWGGGIYNWFDTKTLVRAVARIAEKHRDVRLFFMGIAHPNPDVPEMAIVSQTRELASELGVNGTHVFFNEQWVPLDERHNYLLDADLGVSTHFNHVETTFSFRTRILDYLWAGLPIVSTEGDSFGDLVAREGLGEAVPAEDVEALADALERYLYDGPSITAAQEAVARIRTEFTWTRTLEPLLRFCRSPQFAADRDMRTYSTGRLKKRVMQAGSATATSDPAKLYHQIGSMPKGFARDVALARYYLQHDGVSALGRRFVSRLSGGGTS